METWANTTIVEQVESWEPIPGDHEKPENKYTILIKFFWLAPKTVFANAVSRIHSGLENCACAIRALVFALLSAPAKALALIRAGLKACARAIRSVISALLAIPSRTLALIRAGLETCLNTIRSIVVALLAIPSRTLALIRAGLKACARAIRSVISALLAALARAIALTRTGIETCLDTIRSIVIALLAVPAKTVSLIRAGLKACARAIRSVFSALLAALARALALTRTGIETCLNTIRSIVIALLAVPAKTVSLIRSKLRDCADTVRAIVIALESTLTTTNSWARSALQTYAGWARSVMFALEEALAGTLSRVRARLENAANGIRALMRALLAFPANALKLFLSGCASCARWFGPNGARRHVGSVARQRFRLRNILRYKWVGSRYWTVRAFLFFRSYAADTPAREQALNVCVFLFGSLIAAGGYLAIQYYSENRAQTDFERPGKEVVAFLTETMNRHVGVLKTAQHRFTAKRTAPNRWKFFQFTRDSLKDLPGIQALEWVPRVRARYRKRYEKRAVKDGLFGFRFFGPSGKNYPAANGEHFPIYYVEPYPGNETALGFDLATDPVAAEALRRARDTGKPVTTTFTAVDTGQKAGAGAQQAPGIVVVLPVYNTEILPFTTKERRKRITGFVRGVVRLDRMVQAYRSNLSVPPGLEVSFYSHGKDGKPQLRYHNPPLPANTKALPYPKAGESDDINLTAGFNMVDQNWTMVLRPESRLFLRNLSSAAWAFAIFAILTTAIFMLYLMTSQTRIRSIERSVTERTIELEAEIAQRKQMETELRAAKDEAVDANHAKSEFLAIMSHELRTPLNAISGFSEVMSKEVYGTLGHKNYGEYASFIYDSADHLISLINDILDLSKIEAERYEIHKEVIDIVDAWRSVEEMLGEQIAAAKVTLENRLPSTPICIRADERALRQIFLNLLSNAVKFTPEGGHIELMANFDDTGRLILSVRDSGIGISKEDLELVFEPFKQVESRVARRHKGTGLGLPLTQRLVALHGGQVEIESTPGKGTTVRIVLESNAVVYDTDEPSVAAQPETKSATAEDANQKDRKYATG